VVFHVERERSSAELVRVPVLLSSCEAEVPFVSLRVLCGEFLPRFRCSTDVPRGTFLYRKGARRIQ